MIEECTNCGWQGKAQDLDAGCCPECGAITLPIDQMYPASEPEEQKS